MARLDSRTPLRGLHRRDTLVVVPERKAGDKDAEIDNGRPRGGAGVRVAGTGIRLGGPNRRRPPPPRYALEDGFLVVDGDSRIGCRGVLLFEEGSKPARLCAKLGFSLGSDASAAAAPEAASAAASAAGTSAAGSPGTASAAAPGEGELPETGGPGLSPAVTLGAGSMLLLGALTILALARRVSASG